MKDNNYNKFTLKHIMIYIKAYKFSFYKNNLDLE
jgi:hypothetical protein